MSQSLHFSGFQTLYHKTRVQAQVTVESMLGLERAVQRAPPFSFNQLELEFPALKPPMRAVDKAGSWGRVAALPSNNWGFPQSQYRREWVWETSGLPWHWQWITWICPSPSTLLPRKNNNHSYQAILYVQTLVGNGIGTGVTPHDR